jgi:alkaline phosphatase D
LPSPAHILLIGIDGLRHDYPERYGAPNLLALKAQASGTNHLIPRFPSSTFPNFYSMATGVEPQAHGIVGMHFYDPERGRDFDFRRDGRDGSWYGATPIWVAAERSGIRTASYYWVGTDALIQGIRPTYYHEYDGSTPHQQRIDQVLEWFALSDAERPRLVTLYFSDVDTAGHLFGPESEQTREAVLAVDTSLGILFNRLQDLRPEANVIVVSDHGMTTVERVIQIGTDSDLAGFHIANESSHVMLYARDGASIDSAFQSLSRDTPEYTVYRRQDTPAGLCFSDNARIGDIVIIANGPYILHARDAGVAEDEGQPGEWPKGWHGYDPGLMPEMHAIFYAMGPRIRRGIHLDTLRNTDVHTLLTALLNLRDAPLTGDIARLIATS